MFRTLPFIKGGINRIKETVDRSVDNVRLVVDYKFFDMEGRLERESLTNKRETIRSLKERKRISNDPQEKKRIETALRTLGVGKTYLIREMKPKDVQKVLETEVKEKRVERQIEENIKKVDEYLKQGDQLATKKAWKELILPFIIFIFAIIFISLMMFSGGRRRR